MKTMNNIQRLSVTLMMVLMATATWAYTVTWTNSSGNPAISAQYGSTTIVSGTTEVTAGQTVILTVAKHDSKYLTGLTVQSDVPATEASAPRRRSTSITIQGDVEVRQAGDFTYEFTMPIGNVTITPTFANRKDISSGDYVATINLVESSHVYDWLAHTPVINSVTISSGTVTLTEGTDYTVSGIASITNVGSETITVTGIGKYKGTATKTYSITARSISGDDGAKIQLSQTSYVYNHTVQKPDITGVFMKGQTLYLDTDYQSVTYSNPSPENNGDYTVSITGKGNFTGTASANYTITQMPISKCTFTGNTTFEYNGNVWAPTITLNDGGGDLTKDTHYTVTYSKHEEGHPENNASKDVGTYTMTFTAKNGTNYSGSKEITYSITSAGFAITAIGNQTYTGAAITPTVEVKDGTHELTLHTHYEVVYSNNINVGTARVSVVGINSYNGKFGEVTFNIIPKSVNAKTGEDDDITIELSKTSFTYNASTQKPTVTVKDRGTLLVENRDYTLENAGGVNVGSTYKATIRGLGNYDDHTTKDSDPYSITALTYNNTNTTITLNTTNYVYDGEAKEPTVQQVKVDGIVIPSTDYTYSYTDDHTSAGSKTVTISPSSNHNLSGTATKTYTISPKPVSDLTIELSATSFTYNGAVQYPTVTVKDGGIIVSGNPKTLSAGTDYTLKYDGADAATSSAVGSYTITIKGKGNYSGEINKTYVINYGSSDSDFTVTVSGTYIYNGTAYTPAGSNVDVTDGSQAVVVKNGTTILTPTTDYTLSYRDNINAGTATVTATGTGNYRFVQTGTFTIQPKAITDGMAILSGTDFVTSNQSFVYNAALQKPNVTITDDVTSTTLVEGTDYTLVNDGGTNVASYNATITGIGNYTTGTGGLVKNYSITALSLSGASVTLDPLQSYVYDGKEKRPGVQQVKVGNVVVPATDYVFSYPRDAAPTDDDLLNVNAGNNTAVVYIKPATGNLSDAASTTFSISPKPLTNSMVALQSASGSYTGSAHTVSVTVTDNGLPEGGEGWNIVPASNYDVVPPTDMTNPGAKDIEVVGKNNYSGTITKTYTILPAGGEDYTVTIDGTYTYDGTAKTPHDADANHTNNITVKKGTATTLTLDTDYTVEYRNNINAGNNSAIAIVTGKGKYSFTVEKAFTILQRTMNQDDIVITFSDNSFTYNGNEQKPSVSVKDGNIPLHVGIDYEITYPTTEYIGQGTKTININGIGNYKDTKAATYTINKLSLETAVITLPATRFEYSRGAQTPTPQVKVGNLVISSDDYDVSYDNDNNTSTTADVTNIGQKTVYVTGKNNCDGSKTTTYEIVAKQIDANMVTLNHSVMTYTGSPLDPGVVVKDGEATLVVGTNAEPHEYKVELTNNTNVGTATVTVEGQGNYTGKVQKTFTIQEKVHSDFTIADIAAVTYDGTAHEPTPNVQYSGTNLTLNTDYTLSYTNNVNAGTATVTVTGKGGYEGSTGTKTFTINPKTLISDMVTLSNFTVTDSDPKGFTYNGNNQKPNVTITDAAAPIIADDYDITNAGGVDASTYSVSITGKRNYTYRYCELDL